MYFVCALLQTDNVFEKSSRLSDWLQFSAWSRLDGGSTSNSVLLLFCAVICGHLYFLNLFKSNRESLIIPSVYFNMNDASTWTLKR